MVRKIESIAEINNRILPFIRKNFATNKINLKFNNYDICCYKLKS